MNKRMAVLCLSVVIGSGTVVFGEAGKWELSLAPGYASPVGGTDDYVDGAFSIDGSALFGFSENLSAGLELGYIFNAGLEGVIPGRLVGDLDSDGIEDPIGFDSDADLSVFHITPQIKLSHSFKTAEKIVKPYLIAGGGYYWTHMTAGMLTLSGQTSGGIPLNGFQGTFESVDDKNGGFNIGGGLELGVSEALRLGIDVRYHQIIYDDFDDTKFLIPAFKITYLFP